ncbi:molecular chaperone DnaJ [Arcobacter sp. CECT 8983]|uniref:DnaJ domain-containing protein n=1 Tax=Arcobacter sp. CECT 8983 TaxID=2044508 RepID=UPI00100AAC7B|nr:DnaJ domain-containing protein [Arcobacter sp. CECT 8983]RXJ90440.1 molecular chaperone DnaJ [Arcobacter sp. CECT 8983]
MDYEEFEKAVDLFGILTGTSKKELKQKYLKLSKKLHPDTEEGSDEKFQQLQEAYELLNNYIDSFKYSFDEEEFKAQFPPFTNYKNWNK